MAREWREARGAANARPDAPPAEKVIRKLRDGAPDAGRMSETPRERLAWLMWCFQDGYTNAEDRAGMTNWLLEDPATLHPDDVKLRSHLLAMADEILTALEQFDGEPNG